MCFPSYHNRESNWTCTIACESAEKPNGRDMRGRSNQFVIRSIINRIVVISLTGDGRSRRATSLRDSAQNPSRRVTIKVCWVARWICRMLAGVDEKKQKDRILKHIPSFYNWVFSLAKKRYNSARAAATAASLPFFLCRSLSLSFPLRGRKFVFVSKSGRLALKKKHLFGIGEIESRAGARCNVSPSFF